MKRSLTLLLALVLALFLTLPALAGEEETGDETLTRGGFILALFRLSGIPDTEPKQAVFDDVPVSGELAQAVRWAADAGIVRGYGGGRFGPDDPLTREQMAVMLYRGAQALGQGFREDWLFPLDQPDAERVSPWAEEAMCWTALHGILPGTERELEPKNTVTALQLSPVLARWQGILTGGPDGKNGEVYILYTSDVHCGIDRGFGYAGLELLRNTLEDQGYATLLVDDGDAIQGEPIGMLTEGEAVIQLMNELGYDAAIPGNHEFDYGAARFMALTALAEFPYLSCNFTYLGELVFSPYLILEAAGLRIAFVGVTTPETLRTANPAFFLDEDGERIYGFLEDETGEGVYHAVQAAVDAARANGAELVYVLGHTGLEAAASPWTYADIISHTAGIDVYLDGHSHDTEQVVMLDREGRPVARSACGTQLACIGYSHISAAGEVLETGIWRWPDEIPAPEKLGIQNEVSAAIDAAKGTLEELTGQVIARCDVTLTIYDPVEKDSSGNPIRMVRRAETNLGDFCADVIRTGTGADLAVINGGGIRCDLQSGDITYGDILSVWPFQNTVSVIEATGQQILDALEWGARALPGETGGFLQVSGLRYELDASVPSPCRADASGMMTGIDGARRVKSAWVEGELLDPEKTYSVAGMKYMLIENGDGYTAFDGAEVLIGDAGLDVQLMIDYIENALGGVVGEEYADPYGQGRILFTVG